MSKLATCDDCGRNRRDVKSRGHDGNGEPDAPDLCNSCYYGEDSSVLSDEEASEIASQWHSVMTWNDPGVAMYSVTSTGKVHSEEHRRKLIAYIDEHMDAARQQDEQGEESVLLETNVADLTALRAWAVAFNIETKKGA